MHRGDYGRSYNSQPPNFPRKNDYAPRGRGLPEPIRQPIYPAVPQASDRMSSMIRPAEPVYQAPRDFRLNQLSYERLYPTQPPMADYDLRQQQQQQIPPLQNPYSFNGRPAPVINEELPRRRGGFDRGPHGEDLVVPVDNCYNDRPKGPLLPTPRVSTFEKIGGDMDISRSPSPPERTSRNGKTRWSKEVEPSRIPPRRRSRSRSRSPRDRREKVKYESVSEDIVRDGVVFHSDSYYQFLLYWVDRLDDETRKSKDRDFRGGVKEINEIITKANRKEREKIVLPPECKESDRAKMLHCDTTIIGLPCAIFCGSGYGTRSIYAKHSAAKDLVDKCHRIGVISSELHETIGSSVKFDRKKYAGEVTKAISAVILLKQKMSNDNFPKDVMSQRQLQPNIIDKFKALLRAVMIEVYYQGNGPSDVNVPKQIAETGYGVRKRGPEVVDPIPVQHRRYDQQGPSHFSTEQILAAKEKEIKEKFEKEMISRRKEMEEEIRVKIVQEERAKIREELEREKRIEMMLMQQKQYEEEKQKKEMEQMNKQQEMARIQKEVEDELNKMVVQLETLLLEFREKGYSAVLEMIFASSTFKTIASLAEHSNVMTIEQKRQLCVDLKALLECAELAARSQAQMYNPISIPPVVMPSIGIPNPTGIQQMNVPSSSRGIINGQAGTSYDKDKVIRTKVGDMVLRTFTPIEQRRLTTGKKVVAQDSKTGKWQLATIEKIRDRRVTLRVGSAVWKKELSDLFTEDT